MANQIDAVTGQSQARQRCAEEQRLQREELTDQLLYEAKRLGFTDRTIVKDYRDSLAYDTALFARFAQGLYRKGVRVIGRGIWYTSFAHTDDDIDQALAAAKEVLLEMKAEAGRD